MKQILYLLLILFISNHNLLKGQSLSPKWESCFGGSDIYLVSGLIKKYPNFMPLQSLQTLVIHKKFDKQKPIFN